MFCLSLVLHLFVITTRASVVFEDCVGNQTETYVDVWGQQFSDGSAYDLQSVNIEGCGLRLPCYVTVGDRIPVNVEFYANFVSRQLDQDVTININYIHANTPVTPERCASVLCPVRTDAVTSFTSVMSVPNNMALNQRGFLQWRVNNEEGMQVLCYSVMVQTQTYVQKFLRHMIDDVYTIGHDIHETDYQQKYDVLNISSVENISNHFVFKSYYKNYTFRI